MSGTKVNELFPKQQFKIKGYKIFRKERDRFGGGPMFYVNEQMKKFPVNFYHLNPFLCTLN